MKKIFSLFVFISLLILVGCQSAKEETTTKNNITETTTTIDESGDPVSFDLDEQFAFTAYLSSGLLSNLSSTNVNVSSNLQSGNVVFLNNEETTTIEESSDELEVEEELDEVNIYFEKLKVFMDQGVESTFQRTAETSTNYNFTNQVTYTIEGVTYTIYYTVLTDEEETSNEETTTTEPVETTTTEEVATTEPVETTTTEEVTTTEPVETTTTEEVATTEPVETTTTEEVATTEPVETTTTEEVTTTEPTETTTEEIIVTETYHIVGLLVIDGVEYDLEGYSVIEDNVEQFVFETISREDSDNYVRVHIKNEDGFQRFDIRTVIDGVTKRTDVKLVEEQEDIKVQLRIYDGEIKSTYHFKKMVEDNQTLYMLNYRVDGVNGVIKIFETTDENGEVTYRYQINEAGKRKNIEKNKHHQKGNNNNKNKNNNRHNNA